LLLLADVRRRKSGALTYDPLGRLQTSTAETTTTSFLFDGDNLAGEDNSADVTSERSVPNCETDEPLVWYQAQASTPRIGLSLIRWARSSAMPTRAETPKPPAPIILMAS
jgi:hypothetical protein